MTELTGDWYVVKKEYEASIIRLDGIDVEDILEQNLSYRTDELDKRTIVKYGKVKITI